MVGVDQPGGDYAALAVDHFVTGSSCNRPNLGDYAALDRNLAWPTGPSENLPSDHTLSYRAPRAAVNYDRPPPKPRRDDLAVTSAQGGLLESASRVRICR